MLLEIGAVHSLGLISFLCYFHFLQANERKLKSTVPDQELRSKLLNMIRSLKNCNIEAEFRTLLQTLYDTATSEFSEYFKSEYICGRGQHIGNYQHNPTPTKTCLCAAQGWANVGSRARFPLRERDETTNLIERFFNTFKYDFLQGRNFRRLSELHIIIIDKVIPHYLRDAMMKKSGRVISDHQRVVDRRAKDVSELIHTTNAIIFTDRNIGIAAVHSMTKKDCIHSICLAEMRCTCPFAVSKNAICKHLEAAIILTNYNGRRNADLSIVYGDFLPDALLTCYQHVTDMRSHATNTSSLSLPGSTATEAAVRILSTVAESTSNYVIEAKTIRVASIITPRRTYFVDLHNRVCSCLHNQIYQYCAHVLHAAECLNDMMLAAVTREHMRSETINSVDIGYWRFIGRDDRDITSDFSGSDLLNDSAAVLDADEFQPSSIGDDTTRQILRRLQTLTPRDRVMINNEMLPILDKCNSLQVVPFISVKSGKSHNGNRQDSDRVVKPLYALQWHPKRKRELINDKSVPKLMKTKKLNKALEKKGGRCTFIGSQTFDAYATLPDATLSDNVMRRMEQ